ncbi:carbon-nitrogen hydrolase family protein [Sphingomonas canadensis]|uniref:Carbon-nitrogen hydrolase family protein n=1 Tax=Sphingomonas canadensis TaxID=1219257 RepID=A0ABW3H7D4_9SPHN|nr:carbon-nitrogen hydrolase family protein [Sphingomonas canadensis]MCW3836934.1 carbon-nitrogen hydrolase family protein [Sphingomonas canadensis]
MVHLPKSRVAAVQSAPVFLDPEATVDKACALIAEAAANGARLVAFPEVFVAAYPYWNWLMNPIEGAPWFERLYHASVDLEGPQVARLRAAAREHGCVVVIGINERDPLSVGTLYNTNLIIGDDGALLGRHRKLVPTWAEKLSWAGGDGASIRVYDTPVGRLGTLACGENTNTLARFALLSQGELVHVANYIALPVAPASYNMADAIRIRATAHSFEGKVFTIVACSTVSPEIVAAMSEGRPENRALLERPNSAFSGVIDPHGNLVGDPLIDVEGIVYADIDLADCVRPKLMHDITGGYNRFDVFSLTVDRTPRAPAAFRDPAPETAPDAGATETPHHER